MDARRRLQPTCERRKANGKPNGLHREEKAADGEEDGRRDGGGGAGSDGPDGEGESPSEEGENEAAPTVSWRGHTCFASKC